MNTATYHAIHPIPRPKSRRTRRRAVTTAGMIVGMTLLLGFVALSVDLAVIMVYEAETRASTDAAVLAGVGELWDRTLLPEHLHRIDLPASDIMGESYVEQQARRAQAEARRFAELNSVCGTPLQLRDEDIIFTAWGRENSLTIRYPQTTGRGNPVTRVVGKALGLKSADLIVESQAVIDHRVYGFAPGVAARAPVVPIVVDTFSWYSQVGQAPLIVLELGCKDDVAGNAKLCVMAPLSETETSAHEIGHDRRASGPFGVALDRLCQQIEIGLDRQDLAALPGRAIALDESSLNGKLDVPLASVADVGMLEEIGRALMSIEGQSRVWLLGTGLVGAHGEMGRQIETFAGARVLHCALEEKTLRVILAPTLLKSSCALVRGDQPRNPWVAKVYLVR